MGSRRSSVAIPDVSAGPPVNTVVRHSSRIVRPSTERIASVPRLPLLASQTNLRDVLSTAVNWKLTSGEIGLLSVTS